MRPVWSTRAVGPLRHRDRACAASSNRRRRDAPRPADGSAARLRTNATERQHAGGQAIARSRQVAGVTASRPSSARAARSARTIPRQISKRCREATSVEERRIQWLVQLSFQFIRTVDIDRAVAVVEIQCNRQCHGRLSRRQHDHEQGDQLAVESQRRCRRRRYWLPKATKLTFAPLSTSSIPISTPRAFRFVAMQTTPATNRTAPTTR